MGVALYGVLSRVALKRCVHFACRPIAITLVRMRRSQGSQITRPPPDTAHLAPTAAPQDLQVDRLWHWLALGMRQVVEHGTLRLIRAGAECRYVKQLAEPTTTAKAVNVVIFYVNKPLFVVVVIEYAFAMLI